MAARVAAATVTMFWGRAAVAGAGAVVLRRVLHDRASVGGPSCAKITPAPELTVLALRGLNAALTRKKRDAAACKTLKASPGGSTAVDASRMAGILPAVIPGGITADDFMAVTGMGRGASLEALDGLVGMGVGARDGDLYLFDESDRLSAALAMIREGAPIDDVAAHLDWRSFEGLAARVLESKGFATVRNLVMTKPRAEIDVVGVNLGVAILVDCKHWRVCGASAMRRAVAMQVERTRRYVEGTAGSVAVPAIVSLYRGEVGFVDRVPVVPILAFPSFVDELYGHLGELRTIGTG